MKGSKSLASLTPRLLARKGSARPAMRPQFQPVQQFQEATAREVYEDLGFNDLGLDEAGEEIATTNRPTTSRQGAVVEFKPAAARPEVLRLQEQLAGRVVSNTGRGKPRRSALAEGRQAAFTLRLDADRHLELRLASALAGRSAQQLLTEALDHMIDSLPEVADLAARVGKRK